MFDLADELKSSHGVPADAAVQVVKQSPDLMMVIHLSSPDDTRDLLYISNYATLHVRDVLSRIDGQDGEVRVRSVTAEQFLRAPALASADQITMLEEEKVQAYFTGGTLYAHKGRTEPLL